MSTIILHRNKFRSAGSSCSSFLWEFIKYKRKKQFQGSIYNHCLEWGKNCLENWKILLWIIFIVYSSTRSRFPLLENCIKCATRNLYLCHNFLRRTFVASDNNIFCPKTFEPLWSDYKWNLLVHLFFIYM